jgi:hypothetical protein
MLSTFDVKRILRPRQDSSPTEDFRIIDSWAEYDESAKKSTHEKPLNFLCYELEAMNPETGEKLHFFKAIKFLRVIRLPKGAKQSTALMDKHMEILAGTSENAINLVVMIANIIEPVPLGLLFLYGVQGIGCTIDEAKKQAHSDYLGLIGMMQGTYRVLEMRCIQAQEAEWLREKMYNMEFLTVVRGIPKAAKTGEDGGNKGLGGKNINPDSQGTLEDIITGMADFEYVIQVLSTPVYTCTLQDWSLKTQRDMTDWYAQMQGTKAMSFNVSIPMMFMANQSSSEGWSKAYTDADSVSYSHGETFGSSTGQSVTHGLSESFGQAFGHSSGTSVTDSLSHTQTVSQGNSFGQSFGQNAGQSFGQNANQSSGQNFGQSSSQGTGQSISQTLGQTTGTTVGQNSSTSQSQGTNNSFSQGQSINHSQGSSLGQSFGQSQGQSYNISQGQNWGQSHNLGKSEGGSLSVSESTGQTMGTTVGQTATQSNSHSISSGNNSSVSAGVSTNESTSFGINAGTNSSVSASSGSSYGASEGWSEGDNSGGSITPFGLGGNWGSSSGTNGSVNSSVNESTSASIGSSSGWNAGTSSGYGTNYGVSNGVSNGLTDTAGSSFSNSISQSASQSHSTGVTSGQSWGTNESFGVTSGKSLSEGWGVNQSTSQTQSIGQNVSDGWGLNASQSHGTSQTFGTSQGQSTSESISNSATQGTSDSTSQNWGQSYGISQGQSSGISQGKNYGISEGQNFGTSDSQSYGISQGQSIGRSYSESVTDSYNHGTSDAYGKNWGTNQSQSDTSGTGSSQSFSNGSSGAYMSGISSSMGIGPSIGYNKSYQWLDQQVKDILELLEFQNDRIKTALRGNGAFYTYVYIGCPNEDALSTAINVAKSTWHNQEAMTNPLQVLKLSDEEQRHLLHHFVAFSSDVTRESVAGISEYKYCTVLLPQEFVAYTHLPRISEGGVFAEVADVPKFSVPSMLNGEIYMGTVLSPERYTMNNGYKTPYDYRIDETELMHAFFTGASRSGKTVAAMRFVAELSKVRRKRTKKRLRIVCMDPKNDWRTLARFVEPERFRFFSLGNMNFRPIKINPLKIPYGVTPQYWIDGIIDIYCRAYGLLERGKQMLGETIYALYDECGVFDACDYDDWKERVPELSKQVTFAKVYKRMSEIKARLEDPTNPKGRAGNDTRDAYARLLDRLQAFAREFSIERRLFGTSEGIGVDELIGKDDVTVLESKGLETTFRNFIFGVITSGFYKYGIAHEGGYLSEDEYETVLIIEEASEILTGNDAAGTGSGRDFGMTGQSEFEQILDQSAGYGLFIVAITQKIADMPKSIIANSGLIFAGRLKTVDDIKVVVRALAREDMFEDRDLVKFHPRMPTGWFVCQSSRTFDIKDSEPILVQISRLNINPPTNLEIDEILSRRDVMPCITAH